MFINRCNTQITSDANENNEIVSNTKYEPQTIIVRGKVLRDIRSVA